MFLHHHWQHLIPALSLITANVRDGPFKWCRVDEKPADKRFIALEFLVLLFQDKRTKKHVIDNSSKNAVSLRRFIVDIMVFYVY